MQIDIENVYFMMKQFCNFSGKNNNLQLIFKENFSSCFIIHQNDLNYMNMVVLLLYSFKPSINDSI